MLSTPDELTGLLRSHGILPTQQRLLIARALFENPRHVSAEQIMGQVNEGQAHVSKATVYNTLGLFARNGLVNEVIVDPSRVFYDPNTTHHHHFYNIDTGELTDIEADQLMLSEPPTLPEGTTIAGVDVIVRVRNKTAAS
ncbi:MAG: transcriptional repressor [Halobacteria archaeon]|nr:transcriptional repressor [Halobacteria archaeon]